MTTLISSVNGDVLTEAARASLEALRAAAEAQPDLDAPPEDGAWTPRGVLAHVLGMLETTLPALCGTAGDGGRDLRFETGHPFDLDAIRDLQLAAILDRLEAAQERAFETIAAFDAETMEQFVSTPVGEFPLRRFVEVFLVGHTDRHAAQLRRLAGVVESDPSDESDESGDDSQEAEVDPEVNAA